MSLRISVIKRVTIVFLILTTHFQVKSQQVISNNFLQDMSISLRDYKVGSGFSIVVFEIKDGKYSTLSITSSNWQTKKIIDSIVSTNKKSFFKLSEESNGYYALPIIQVMYDEEKDRLNWENSSYWDIAGFGEKFKLPGKTTFLKPLMTISTSPIK